jgi:chromosome segregation ATPase
MANLDLLDATISQEELDRLEQENPLDAFAFLMKNDALFSKNSGKSSNVSADAPSQTSKENLLAEFRDKILKINLLEVIEQDETVIDEVKELLRKLSELPSGSKFQDLSQVLEPLLDSINQSFQQKKTSQVELEEQTQRCDQLLADVSAFNIKFEAFQQETPVTRQRVEEIDAAIAKRKAEIQDLKTQKANLLDKEKLMKQCYPLKG